MEKLQTHIQAIPQSVSQTHGECLFEAHHFLASDERAEWRATERGEREEREKGQFKRQYLELGTTRLDSRQSDWTEEEEEEEKRGIQTDT